MRSLSFGEGLWAAIKVDTISIVAWQIGMYGFAAFANFVVFRIVLGAELAVDTFEFWFMIQIAMLCGFLTPEMKIVRTLIGPLFTRGSHSFARSATIL